MSDETLDDILRQLGGTTDEADTKEEVPETPEVKEAEVVEAPVKVEDEDPLAGLLVDEETPEVKPEPVKKKRGRPAGSTNKKAPAAKKEPEVKPDPEAEKVSAADVVVEGTAPEQIQSSVINVGTIVASSLIEADILSQGQVDNSTTENKVTVELAAEISPPKPKDIYILSEAQIFNGHIYRRGQKITFTPGDKFYQSQVDRNGKNWLDLVDDLDAQYAHFGRVIVEPNHWSGIPLGSTAGIEHPGLALALAKIAQEEYERNGTPHN